MNKVEFLTTLTKKLTALSQQEREDILSEYSQYIEDKMATGLSEEEAISGFGDIDELARELISAYSADPNFNIKAVFNRAAYYADCFCTFVVNCFVGLWNFLWGGCVSLGKGIAKTWNCCVTGLLQNGRRLKERFQRIKTAKKEDKAQNKEETMEEKDVKVEEVAEETTVETTVEQPTPVVEQAPFEEEPKVEQPTNNQNTHAQREESTKDPASPTLVQEYDELDDELDEETTGVFATMAEVVVDCLWGIVAFFGLLIELVLFIPFMLILVALGGTILLATMNYPVWGILLILLGATTILGAFLYLIYYYVLGGMTNED